MLKKMLWFIISFGAAAPISLLGRRDRIPALPIIIMRFNATHIGASKRSHSFTYEIIVTSANPFVHLQFFLCQAKKNPQKHFPQKNKWRNFYNANGPKACVWTVSDFHDPNLWIPHSFAFTYKSPTKEHKILMPTDSTANLKWSR